MFRSLAFVLTWVPLFRAVAQSAEKAEPAKQPAAAKSPIRAEHLVRDRGDGVDRIPLLPPGPGNPRNSNRSIP
jgi:hypothetical protein